MQGCGLCDASAKIVARRFALFPHVRYVCLAKNRISNIGIARLAEGLKANSESGGRLCRVDH